MPLQATSGAASYDAFGGGVPFEPTYIEQIFSTFLYTGNGSTQTINNGIDLAGEGGLVWIKKRSDTNDHALFDTNRGYGIFVSSNTTDANSTQSTSRLSSFNVDGFSLGTSFLVNQSTSTYASWTFRKQPKFFDVVTYTGTGSNTTIAHNLGSVPGCIIVKRTDTTGDWQVYHRANTGAPQTDYLVLNSTAATVDSNTRWNDTLPTDTVFSLGTDVSVNASGGTYVAYLFAHDAGGFGLEGTDNVISCGSYTGNSGTNVINLGFEPQWVMVKAIDKAEDWAIFDNMRGITGGGNGSKVLWANRSTAEEFRGFAKLTATGFTLDTNEGDSNLSGYNYIYIAIRRGPMKVPTTGTSVFGLNARTGTGAIATVTGGAGVSDAVLVKNRGAAVASLFSSRLTGTGYLVTSTTAAEVAAGTTILQANPWDVMDGVKVGTTSTITNASANTYINYLFDRAPGFFDVVCYTGDGAIRNLTHSLTVAPEFCLIFKRSADESSQFSRLCYVPLLGANKYLLVDTTAGSATSTNIWNNTLPTANVITLGASGASNNGSTTYVAYLFATCPGVSKVFSFTGNGTTQTINCGFTGGARFVMIKRTDSTGDWYVWDTARGIVSGNDPHLSLNTTAAEVTTDDTIDTDSTGFVVNQVAATNVNVNAATYIGIAIA